MRGALSSGNVFKAVCSGYLPGTEPDVCKICTSCGDNDVLQCTIEKRCTGAAPNAEEASKKTVSKGQLFMSLFCVSGVFCGIGYWQWKRSQRQMRDQVRGILAEYMPLDENGKDADGSFSFATAMSDGTQIT